MTVYFIGAGPGDPELITVKATKAMQGCKTLLYAGSLVPRAIIDAYASHAEHVLDTAPLNLIEIIEEIKKAHAKGHDVARVHSGDTSIYGAIGEQIRQLRKLNIDFEIIPGVTAVAASAALLEVELTLSGVSQTVILTRYEGKTPFPERERLPALAQSQATLAIHLGINHIHKIVDDLIPFYGEDCPVAVCYRTSWPDQDFVTGSLSTIVKKVRAKKFTRTALILVGKVLNPEDFNDSYLYDARQAHVYRPKSANKKKQPVNVNKVHPIHKR